ncbi:hypothetical protein BBFGKLBO_02761 [Synechococcus sp. CBW1107]|nr:hypothetical protein BBFGKLBO_02761 [Synechococcus sp. CBW1107]
MNRMLHSQDGGVMGRKPLGFSDDGESMDKQRAIHEDSTLMVGAAAQPHAICPLAEVLKTPPTKIRNSQR